MKNVVIKGAYGESNFGDDLLMLVVDDFFEKNFHEIRTFFLSSEVNTYMNPLLKHSKAIAMTELNTLDQIDLLVYGGGTQFFAFRDSTSKVKNFLYLLKNDFPLLLKTIKHKILLKKNVSVDLRPVRYAAIGIGIGPFHTPESVDQKSREFLLRSNFTAVRDQVSMDICNQWGLNNVFLGADMCFSKYFRELPFISYSTPNLPGKPKRIGIIVRDWTQDEIGKRYYSPLMNVVKKMNKDSQFDVRFIIFAPHVDKGWQKRLQDEDVLEWDPKTNTVQSFFQSLGSFDGFITARYHGGVFASLMNKPTICIEVEPKLKILVDQIPEFKLWNQPFSESALVTLIQALFKEDFDCSRSVAKLSQKSDEMFNEFHNYVQTLTNP